MPALRLIPAAAAVAFLLCQSVGIALAQEAAPPAATATPPAAIKPVLDAANRRIRLEPLGTSVQIPADVAIGQFLVRDNFFGVTGDFGPNNFTSVEVTFISGGTPQNCEAYFAQSYWEKKRFKTPKKGAEFYDSRWYPKYQESKSGWITYCLDHPGGFLSVYDTPLKGNPEPLWQFNSNLADAFVPPLAQPAAVAAAPAPTSNVDVRFVVPFQILSAADRCNTENSQTACQASEGFWALQQKCMDGSATACNGIGNMAAGFEDWSPAAKYFQRACELGETSACKKAASAEKKRKKN